MTSTLSIGLGTGIIVVQERVRAGTLRGGLHTLARGAVSHLFHFCRPLLASVVPEQVSRSSDSLALALGLAMASFSTASSAPTRQCSFCSETQYIQTYSHVWPWGDEDPDLVIHMCNDHVSEPTACSTVPASSQFLHPPLLMMLCVSPLSPSMLRGSHSVASLLNKHRIHSRRQMKKRNTCWSLRIG